MNNTNITYTLDFSKQAMNDIQALKKSEKSAFRKLTKLLDELLIHPTTGTGKPEILRNSDGIYSRRITQKHRLIYAINEEKVTVLIISAYGHYNDK